MSELLNELNIHEHLTAFADGELNAEQIVEVLDYISEHPESIEMMRSQQLLRVAAFRSIIRSTPQVPESLRQRILALASEVNQDLAKPRDSDKFLHSKRRGLAPVFIAATAAMLFGLIIGRHLLKPIDASPELAQRSEEPITPSLVTAVTRVHVDCSRFKLQLHSAPFPTSAPFTTLASDVEQEFHSKVPYPDLTSIGYAFVGAGPCLKPLQNTVHLLYRSTRPTLRDTLSVFVQPYAGQVKIQPNEIITVAGATAAHPCLVWRSQTAVFVLVTDDFKTATDASTVMRVAMK